MSDAKEDTRTGEVRSESWIEAGFEEIARTGVEGVRVEVLAKNLGVTKGGFYRRFRDRAALLEAMLQDWSAGRIAAPIELRMRSPILGCSLMTSSSS